MNDKNIVPEVTISKRRYDELIACERKVCALENAGVDNWSGYGYAMSDLYDDEEDEY